MTNHLRIGEVAASVGINVQTLRFHDREGLLPAPARRSSGYPDYSPEAAIRIRLIKRAQQLGLSLAEAKELLSFRDGDRASCSQVKCAAAGNTEEIDRKLADLRAIQRALGKLVASCASGSSRTCPILEALDDASAGGARA